jgi:hypothetical protein
MATTVADTQQVYDITAIDDPQVAIFLLRSCASVSRIIHLLRTLEPHVIKDNTDLFDEGLQTAAATILSLPAMT